jgi:integrase
MKLDAKTVAGLGLSGKKDVIHFDDALSGFGYRLRAGAEGKILRSWIAQYRRAGATRRYLIGSADTLTAEQARTMAKKVLAKVALGEDPQGDKGARRDKDKLSLRSVVDEYLASKEKSLRRRTLVETKRYLTGSYFRSLHAMPVDQISRRDIASKLVTISRESGSATARHARAVLSAMYVWGMRSGLVEANPVANTPEPDAGAPRERTLTDNEVAAVWRAADAAGEYGKVIQLLILTGCRRSEIGGLRWTELNPESGTWVLPAARSKNGRSHTLPLSPAAWAIIDQMPRMAFRDSLFGLHGSGFTGWSLGKQALDARSGVSGWTVHDIRRSVATKMADLGIQPHIIEQILNHASGHKAGIAGIYNRSSYEREVKSALALWADHVEALVNGVESTIIAFTPPAAS